MIIIYPFLIPHPLPPPPGGRGMLFSHLYLMDFYNTLKYFINILLKNHLSTYMRIKAPLLGGGS